MKQDSDRKLNLCKSWLECDQCWIIVAKAFEINHFKACVHICTRDANCRRYCIFSSVEGKVQSPRHQKKKKKENENICQMEIMCRKDLFSREEVFCRAGSQKDLHRVLSTHRSRLASRNHKRFDLSDTASRRTSESAVVGCSCRLVLKKLLTTVRGKSHVHL